MRHAANCDPRVPHIAVPASCSSCHRLCRQPGPGSGLRMPIPHTSILTTALHQPMTVTERATARRCNVSAITSDFRTGPTVPVETGHLAAAADRSQQPCWRTPAPAVPRVVASVSAASAGVCGDARRRVPRCCCCTAVHRHTPSACVHPTPALDGAVCCSGWPPNSHCSASCESAVDRSRARAAGMELLPARELATATMRITIMRHRTAGQLRSPIPTCGCLAHAIAMSEEIAACCPGRSAVNAERYVNAAQLVQRLMTLRTRICVTKFSATAPYAVFHDATSTFEQRYGLHATGSDHRRAAARRCSSASL